MSVRLKRVKRLFKAALFARAFCVAIISLPVFLGNAAAQENADQDVSPNISVADRFRQTYGADGMRAGGFTLFPSLNLSQIYDDNIFGDATDPTDDLITDISGALRLRSNWSIHGLELVARGQRRIYHDNSDESTTDYEFGGSGFFELGARSRVRYSGTHRRATEARRNAQTVAGSNNPVRFSRSNAAIDFDFRQTRLREQFGVSFRSDNFDDVLVGAVLTDQDFRDRKIYSAYFRQSYRIRPAIAAFVQVAGALQEYDSPQPGTIIFQDSETYRISGGLALDINKVARGEIGVGYQSRDYDDPFFTDVSGFNVDAELEYFLSDLTTVTLTADRSIQDTAVPGVAGYYSTGGGINVEHELIRPVLLVANVTYQSDDFRGIDRTDKLFRASAGVNYAFRREVIFSFRYTYLDLSSSGADARGAIEENILRLGVELRL